MAKKKSPWESVAERRHKGASKKEVKEKAKRYRSAENRKKKK